MKNLLLLLGVCLTALLVQTNALAQNVFSGEPVQWVGRPNGYGTNPYGTDYRTTSYRKVSTTATNPTDGRAQWSTTINVQSSGGDITPDNMSGGGGAGWLFISGPLSNRFQNKWNFNGVGQGALNAINGIVKQSGGNDMGLNMGTAGYYTFNMRDAGYANTEFYVGYTANAPVTVSLSGQTFSGGQPVINIATSAAPSAGENVYVRYRASTNDFTTNTSVVQAAGSGTSWVATLPQQTCGSTVYYYIYTSTRSLSQIGTDSENDRSLGTLRYADNGGNNYSFSVSPVPTAGITNNSGTTVLTCAQTAISLSATGGATYSWDNGLGAGAAKSITVPGTYTVTVTGDNGCTATAQAVITQNTTTPSAGITNNSGVTVLTCTQTAISVTATGGASYAWNNGLGSGASKSITSAGTYTVTVTGANGCTSTASVTVTADGANTWNGTSGNFSDASKWSCGVPAAGDVIVINAGNVTLDVNFTVQGSLTLSGSGTLTVSPTATLSVGATGTVALSGRPVTFKSDATGTASLGQVTGTLTGATNVTVERYLPNNGFRSWRLLSVPTFGNGQTIKEAWQENQAPLANNNPGYGTQITTTGANAATVQALGFDNTSTYASLLKWNGSAWITQTSTLQPIAGQKAWFLFVRGDRTKGNSGGNFDVNATTLRTNGTVYTGDQVNNIGASAFALVGNVYPSAIDFTGLPRTGGVSNIFYIWDSKKMNGNSLGAYQTFSGTNSYNCILGGGSYTLGQPNTVIESGQAFFVQSSTAGTITLKESAKINPANGNLGLRPAAQPAKIDSRLYNSNNDMLDANTVVFDAAYSKAVDAADAPKLGNPGVNFAIETDSKLIAIEGTAPVQDNDVVQFRMWNLQPQTYQLEIAANKMASDGLTAVLEDKYLQTATTIDLNSSIRVNFTVDANAGSSDANRFRIVFKKAAIAIADSRKGYSIAPNPVENGTMNLQFRNQAAGKYAIRVMSLTGQTLQQAKISHAGGTAAQQITLPANMASGSYQVEIISPDKTRTVQMMVVNNK